MAKVNEIESVLKKTHKTFYENELTISEFNDGDEENQSFKNDINFTAANHSFEGNLTKRSPIPKRKARFKPLHCIVERRKFTRNQKFFLKQRIEQKGDNDLEKEIVDEQEIQIEWESSEESELDTTALKESNNITNTTSSSQLAENERPKSNEHTKNLFRRCRRGGYLHQFEQAIDKAKTDQKFLKYDQKFGIEFCQTLLIQKITQSFGVYIARCRSMEDDREIEVILDRFMGKHVKIGDRFFFKQIDEAYEINSSQLPIVLQPRKICMQT